MKILGNRVLVSPLEKEITEGFTTVEVQDSFVYKGKVEKFHGNLKQIAVSIDGEIVIISIGDTIIFVKYSPDTHEIEYESKKYKSIKVEDILAVL